MTDFRVLLEDLVEEVIDANQYMPPGVQSAIERARAALAEPQPEGPTDEELTLTYALAVAAAVDGMTKPWPADLCERAQLAGLRAVLARWGTQQ